MHILLDNASATRLNSLAMKTVKVTLPADYHPTRGKRRSRALVSLLGARTTSWKSLTWPAAQRPGKFTSRAL
eukprot:335534-Amphidinium_carterae.1